MHRVTSDGSDPHKPTGVWLAALTIHTVRSAAWHQRCYGLVVAGWEDEQVRSTATCRSSTRAVLEGSDRMCTKQLTEKPWVPVWLRHTAPVNVRRLKQCLDHRNEGSY